MWMVVIQYVSFMWMLVILYVNSSHSVCECHGEKIIYQVSCLSHNVNINVFGIFMCLTQLQTSFYNI
jgi:hypothetical protein